MKFSPLPCYLVPLSPKYFPQHSILKHPQPTLFLKKQRTIGHTNAVELLCTSDRLFAETATHTTHNKHKIQISIYPAGIKPVITAIKHLQTHHLDRKSADRLYSVILLGFFSSHIRRRRKRNHLASLFFRFRSEEISLHVVRHRSVSVCVLCATLHRLTSELNRSAQSCLPSLFT
jgi:hypothetical protein